MARSATAENFFQLGTAAAEAGNHDEAYGYFSRVLEADPSDGEAWFGKASAAGWDSDLRRDRYNELLAGMKRAVKNATDVEGMKKKAAKAINKITVAYFELSKNHTAEFISLDGTWEEHLARCMSMLHALQEAHAFDPSNQKVLKNGIDLAKQMLDGVWFEHEFDDGNIETKGVPPELSELATQIRNGFIADLQKLDPKYKAAAIEPVGGFTFTGCIALLVVLAIIAGGAWLLWTKVIHKS